VLGGLSESVFDQTLNEEMAAIQIFVCVDVRQSTNVCHPRFIHFDVTQPTKVGTFFADLQKLAIENLVQ
jgi:hypothetical protein